MTKYNSYFEKISTLAKKSYCPYSNFPVSCLIKTKNNILIMGVNVENVSYGGTICAERTALTQFKTKGFSKNDVKYFFVYTTSKDFIFPCGMCLQVMVELLLNNQKIIIFNKNGKMRETFLNQILIYPFQKK